MKHFYTEAEKQFIADNIKGRTRKELCEMFNEYFDLNLGLNQITAYIKNNGLSSGINTRFTKGQDSWNKGTKGICAGGIKTQFKKGQKPHNYKPVGSERVNGDGYVDVKIADPNKWKAKHRLLWEKENGPIPKGHVIIFGDGNRRNFQQDNLILVSKSQLVILNKNQLIKDNADLTRVGVVIADIYKKIGERKKNR
ncbi:HNH endonuclease signature motif containing protein [Bacillus cereus]|uniref:HNH endonuclease signature motif containing protein n=1 Tax=Bacillati TaxID=1783272 RepID=UPI000676E337|nr:MULTISPECIES: HNH endonuclease signature motif containing protein [Bacillaceae]MEB8879359.1 HNH endonuclease signature motif containing protein [Bacillus cereus]AKR38513.1 Phage protein [Bacillus thuringiensis serovar indiana]MBG9642287.1 phage protein [Bacillus thuringiensis]MBG9642346.1 phage protein [Bacillus thuringiensis]MBG9649122.1 phage protein [Bacillus thuringiensis]